MTVSCITYLPNDVRADDVVKAIAYLLGASREKRMLGPRYPSSYAAGCLTDEVSTEPNCKAKYVYPVSTYDMQYYRIQIAPTNIDREWHDGSLFVYPTDEHPEYISLSGGSTKFWKILGAELIKLFGGEVDCNDCDNIDVDFSEDKPRRTNSPYRDEEWQEFENAFFALPQIAKFVNKFD